MVVIQMYIELTSDSLFPLERGCKILWPSNNEIPSDFLCYWRRCSKYIRNLLNPLLFPRSFGEGVKIIWLQLYSKPPWYSLQLERSFKYCGCENWTPLLFPISIGNAVQNIKTSSLIAMKIIGGRGEGQ